VFKENIKRLDYLDIMLLIEEDIESEYPRIVCWYIGMTSIGGDDGSVKKGIYSIISSKTLFGRRKHVKDNNDLSAI